MPKTVQEIRKLGLIANWYMDEGDRAIKEINPIAAMFWYMLAEYTSEEMESK